VVSEFVSRLFGRTSSQDQQPDGDRDPEQPAGGQTDQRTEALSPQAQSIAEQLAGLPADELGRLSQGDTAFARAVQAEVDRRTARANKERDAQGRFTRQQRVEQLKQQARQARQTDVYKAAELEEQVDGLQQQEAFVRGVVENYDRVSIDPIMRALPERDRAALMADLPEGLDGREQLVTAALARLKVVWQAEAVRKVNGRPGSTNGSSQVLPPQNPPPRRAKPVPEDDEDEPEVSVSGRGRRPPVTMNDWIRGQMAR
jgi:hypothetical protein